MTRRWDDGLPGMTSVLSSAVLLTGATIAKTATMRTTNLETAKSETAAAAAKRVYADHAAFEQMRPVITRLYHDEQRTLRDTAEAMAREHGFFAT